MIYAAPFGSDPAVFWPMVVIFGGSLVVEVVLHWRKLRRNRAAETGMSDHIGE